MTADITALEAELRADIHAGRVPRQKRAADTIAELRRKLDEARAIAKPLSDALDDQGNPDPADFPDDMLLDNSVSVTFGDCRAASRWLEGK